MRRLEGQHLLLRGQRVLHFAQRSARAHGDHQLAGLVALDATPGARIKQLPTRRIAVEILGAAGTDAQRLARAGRGLHSRDHCVQGSVHQNRGRSGKGTRAGLHAHPSVFGAAMQRRHHLAGVQQSRRIEGTLDAQERIERLRDRTASTSG